MLANHKQIDKRTTMKNLSLHFIRKNAIMGRYILIFIPLFEIIVCIQKHS